MIPLEGRITTVEQLERWLLNNNFTFEGRGLVYRNTGYTAIYTLPDYDYLLKELDKVYNSDYEDMEYWSSMSMERLNIEVLRDRLSTYCVHSYG